MGFSLAGLAWIDPLAFAIVCGGSVVAARARATRSEARAAIAALHPLLHADPEADAEAAARAVGRVEAIAEAKGIVCVDRVATTGRFLGEAVRRLSDARSGTAYAAWAEETMAARAARHAGAIGVWSSLADAAPAMGMIATVIGLVRMFAHLDDPALIGPPMATALVATLMGLLLANLVAGPIAARLERLSAAEQAWQRRALDHFVALARAELDQPAAVPRRFPRSHAA